MKRYWQPILLGIFLILIFTACGMAGVEPMESEQAHTHAWSEWTETATPSCTEEGKHERTCAACGETETKLIHPFGHMESGWITDPNRTCLIESAKHTMCLTCGETIQTEIIYAEGHKESDWIVDRAVTCTVDGARHKVCNSCNEVTATETIKAPGHTVGDWIVDLTATCTTDGARHKACTTCGTTTETETLYATGHQNGDWITDRAATCTLDGMHHKVCAVCKQTTETETIYALGHQNGDWIIDRAATCTTDGVRHKTCAVCGANTLNEKIYASGHTAGDWIVDRAATCALEGIRHQSCVKCDEMLKSEVLTVPHTEVIDAAIPATCLAAGLTEGKHCAVCQAVLIEQLSLDITDHTYGQDGLCTSCHITDERYLDFTWLLNGTYSVSAKEGVEMPSHLIIPVTYKGKAVTKIKDNAFENCNTLQSITIPDSVTAIGESAFAYCRALESITIPEGVSTIQHKTFYECSSLTDVNLPESVIKLGDAAFSGCRSMTEITLPRGVTELSGSLFGSCGFTSFTVPNHIKTIGAYVFVNCTKLTSVTILNSVTKIGKEAFKKTSLEDIYYSGTAEDWNKITVNDPNENLKAAAVHYQDANAYLLFTKNGNSYEVKAKDVNNLPEVLVIPAEYEGLPVTRIDNSAFAGATSLKQVIIPDCVTAIEYNAFRDCTNLTSLSLPEGLTELGSFHNGLAAEVFNTDEQGNKYLGTASNPYFALVSLSNNRITSYVTRAETKIVCSGAFSQCNDLTEVTISEGVRLVMDSAFQNCESLCKVSFPKTVNFSYNPHSMFGRSPNISRITIDAEHPTLMAVNNCIIEKTSGRLIIGCASSIIPDDGSVKVIGSGSFQNVPIEELVIPEGVVEICNESIRYCDNLRSVTIPSTVKTIGYSAFSGDDALTSIMVAEGNATFVSKNNCVIRRADNTLVAMAGNVVADGVEKIEAYSLYTNSFSGIILPASLTEIGEAAFELCDNLTDVYYAGTAEQWAKVKIGEQNDSLLNATIHYSSTAP